MSCSQSSSSNFFFSIFLTESNGPNSFESGALLFGSISAWRVVFFIFGYYLESPFLVVRTAWGRGLSSTRAETAEIQERKKKSSRERERGDPTDCSVPPPPGRALASYKLRPFWKRSVSTSRVLKRVGRVFQKFLPLALSFSNNRSKAKCCLFLSSVVKISKKKRSC